EDRVIEVTPVSTSQERIRKPGHPVPYDPELVDSRPVVGVAGHADHHTVAAQAAPDKRLARALDAEEEDRPIERHAIDPPEPAPRRDTPAISVIQAGGLDRHVSRAGARCAALVREQIS